MTCIECQNFFSDYYDGCATDTVDFMAHLSECAICASEYKKFVQLFDEIHLLPQTEDTPPGFLEHMVKHVNANKNNNSDIFSPLIHNVAKREKTRLRKFAPFVAAVAVLAASFIFVLSFINFGSDVTPITPYPYIPIVATDGLLQIEPHQALGIEGRMEIVVLEEFVEPAQPRPARNNTMLATVVSLVIVSFLGTIVFILGRTRG